MANYLKYALFGLVGAVIAAITGCSQQITTSGGAYLKDEIIRGMDISACTPVAIQEIQAVLDKHQQEFFKKDYPSDIFLSYYNVAKEKSKTDLVKTFNTLSDSKQCLTKTSTDIEGKYSLSTSVKEMDSHPQLFAYSKTQYLYWAIGISSSEKMVGSI